MKNIIEEEFEVENWSRFIVLTSNQKPLTKISPFIIEKNNQTRAILEFRGSPSESIRYSKDGILEQ
jgi:hypothetical protein